MQPVRNASRNACARSSKMDPSRSGAPGRTAPAHSGYEPFARGGVLEKESRPSRRCSLGVRIGTNMREFGDRHDRGLRTPAGDFTGSRCAHAPLAMTTSSMSSRQYGAREAREGGRSALEHHVQIVVARRLRALPRAAPPRCSRRPPNATIAPTLYHSSSAVSLGKTRAAHVIDSRKHLSGTWDRWGTWEKDHGTTG